MVGNVTNLYLENSAPVFNASQCIHQLVILQCTLSIYLSNHKVLSNALCARARNCGEERENIESMIHACQRSLCAEINRIQEPTQRLRGKISEKFYCGSLTTVHKKNTHHVENSYRFYSDKITCSQS